MGIVRLDLGADAEDGESFRWASRICFLAAGDSLRARSCYNRSVSDDVLKSPLDPDFDNVPLLRERIVGLAEQVREAGSGNQDFKTIVGSLLHHTEEQLEHLLSSHKTSDIPRASYATRSLLELLVWTGFILKSRSNTERFAEDWILDGIGLLEALD